MITLNGTSFNEQDIREIRIAGLPSWQQPIFEFLKNWLEQESFIVNTSGSTGKPKTITLTKETMRSGARKTGDFLGWKGGETALLALPAAYIAGKMMLVRAMEWDLDLRLFEPTSNLNWENPAHFTALTPMQASMSLEALQHFEQIILGGGPISSILEDRLLQLPCSIWHTYGMTETASHVALRKIGEPHFDALPGVEFRVGEDTCLIISADHLPETLHTTDMVELLSPTRFIWKGRRDNMINTGGIKVNPEEIEKALEPTLIGHFFVTSVPDPVLGEQLILVLEQSQDLDFSGLHKHHRPKDVLIREFIFTETGKVDRKRTLASQNRY